jgi:cytochrome b561
MSGSMQTDFALHQRSGHEEDLASLRHRAWTHEAPISSPRASFDNLTVALHWVTVLLVLALFASAWLHALAEVQQSALAAALLQIHRSLGVSVWVVTALRLAWRLTKASVPAFPTRMTKLHRALVKWSEYGLYALLIGQPSTGLLATLFSGHPFALFFWPFSPLMRDDMLQRSFHFSHEFGAWALAVLTVSHAAAALFHHLVLCDGVLERMAPVMRQRQGGSSP